MDILSQTKLSASEWESIEIPVTESELKILNMIHNSYGKEEVNKITNTNLNMIRFTKMTANPEIQAFLYRKYFLPIVQKNLENMKQKWKPFDNYKFDSKIAKKLKKADSIRIENSDKLIQANQHDIYEFDCMKYCNQILHLAFTGKPFASELYTLQFWRQSKMENTNQYVLDFMDMILHFGNKHVSIEKVISDAETIIEKNPNLYKYENISLYSHQKELFTLCLQSPKRKRFEDEDEEETGPIHYTPKPKLILYSAPTGTGKTLSPIGLTNEYKVIFVCVARHVGLALAKSAISMNKRVGFAFGCDSANDIRLHYFSAADYTKNRRTGGIWKVNHNVGSKVELMICDVHSYLHAMRYMIKFTKDRSTLLTYWDEPTMTLDYEDHPLHSVIQNNWQNNEIYNMVLSCATLPKEDELQDAIMDYRLKVQEYFDEQRQEKEFEKQLLLEEIEEYNQSVESEEEKRKAVLCEYVPIQKEDNTDYIVSFKEPEPVEVYTITSYDCRKSIPILNQSGYCFMPHIHCNTIEELHSYASYCKENKTLLRYFDLKGIIDFVQYIHEHNLITKEYHHMDNYFESIEDVSMNKLKLYYLDLLQSISKDQWKVTRTYLMMRQEKKYKFMNNKSRNTSSNTLTRLHSNPVGTTSSTTITRNNSESQVDQIRKTEIQNTLDGVYLTTKDAHTLTDGPSIYLADNILNMAKFYVRESRLPDVILKQLVDTITRNEKLYEKIEELEQKLEEELSSDNVNSSSTSKKKDRGSGSAYSKNASKDIENGNNTGAELLKENIDNMRDQIRQVTLNPHYIPNSHEHQEKWTPGGKIYESAFRGSLNEQDIKDVLELEISIQFKVLVLMGVGVLIQQEKKAYEEIIKRLAVEQKLFLILTSSDYIYGTNYQFCHGFIGKDLKNMTPQKTLQAMGRVGRNKHQQDYTIRFRDDSMIHGLFHSPEVNREAYNMNKLFCRD